jgi:hypothetical protein
LKVLHARYKLKTVEATIAALAADVERLESELAQADEVIAAAEAAFLESVAPDVKHREEIGVTLSRARIARHYLSDANFRGLQEMPADAALREYQEARLALDNARMVLAQTIEPTYDRAEALGDADRWRALHDYETIRDRVDELLGAESRARQTAERFGHGIPPLSEKMEIDGDPFNPPRVRNRTEGMVNI